MMHLRNSLLPTCALLVGILLPGASAAAPQDAAAVEPTEPEEATPAEVSDEERARALRKEGEDLYFGGDYEGALRAFEDAQALSAHSTDLFNIGRIHEEMGQLPEALARYEEFVAQPNVPLEERAAAAERIEVLRKLVHKDDPPPPVSTSVRPVGSDPRDDMAFEAEQRAQRRLRVAGITVAALGGAVAVGGGVGFGIVARRSSDKIDDLSDGRNPSRLSLSEAEDLEARGRDFETMQIAAMATGGVMVGAGVAMLIVAHRRRARFERARGNLQTVSPFVSSQSLSLHARWRF
jgi:tetratricopeptide (TPR) repeat protein